MNDSELDDLLAGWRAPSIPRNLEQRILTAHKGDWITWLWKGRIQIPVPAIVLTVCVMAVLLALLTHTPVGNQPRMARSEGLQPVKHLKVRIIRSNYEGSN